MRDDVRLPNALALARRQLSASAGSAEHARGASHASGARIRQNAGEPGLSKPLHEHRLMAHGCLTRLAIFCGLLLAMYAQYISKMRKMPWPNASNN